MGSVANATADLLMLGAWMSALGSIRGDPIPVRNIFTQLTSGTY
jgi:hypothetical protein